jgi:hypothetical protein
MRPAFSITATAFPAATSRTLRTIAILLAGTLSLTACMGGGGGRRPAVTRTPSSSAEAALRGQWELVTIEAQGEERQADGSLSFDENNRMTLRAELEPGQAGAVPPRTVVLDFAAVASVSGPSELTFVGLQTRAPQEQMVPTASDPSAWRNFSVEGDTLRVWQTGPDGRPAGVLVFRRVQ